MEDDRANLAELYQQAQEEKAAFLELNQNLQRKLSDYLRTVKKNEVYLRPPTRYPPLPPPLTHPSRTFSHPSPSHPFFHPHHRRTRSRKRRVLPIRSSATSSVSRRSPSCGTTLTLTTHHSTLTLSLTLTLTLTTHLSP